MKIKVTFSTIVDADSIDEAYDKVAKDIASSTDQQGDQQGDQHISKGEKNTYMRCLTELTDMCGFTFEELGEHAGYGEGSVDYDY